MAHSEGERERWTGSAFVMPVGQINHSSAEICESPPSCHP